MLVTGRMEEIAKEMEEYKIGVLALQETRWKGEGRIDKESTLCFMDERKNKEAGGRLSW
jgi:hypothetical protein